MSAVRRLVLTVVSGEKTCDGCGYLPQYDAKYGVNMCGLFQSKVYLAPDKRTYLRTPDCIDAEEAATLLAMTGDT